MISGLVGQLRQYQGLCYLRKSLLGSDILHPSGVARFTGPVVKESHNLQVRIGVVIVVYILLCSIHW